MHKHITPDTTHTAAICSLHYISRSHRYLSIQGKSHVKQEVGNQANVYHLLKWRQYEDLSSDSILEKSVIREKNLQDAENPRLLRSSAASLIKSGLVDQGSQ
jgi:hypothetical protein